MTQGAIITKPIMSINEYATYSGIGKNRLRALKDAKKLPHFMIGSKAYINVKAADEYFEEQARQMNILGES